MAEGRPSVPAMSAGCCGEGILSAIAVPVGLMTLIGLRELCLFLIDQCIPVHRKLRIGVLRSIACRCCDTAQTCSAKRSRTRRDHRSHGSRHDLIRFFHD